MKKNELTEVTETKQGILILQVLEHYDEGEQSLAKVKNEIMDKLYRRVWNPRCGNTSRRCRAELCGDQAGLLGCCRRPGNSEIQEVSATPEASKVKKGRRNFSCLASDPEIKREHEDVVRHRSRHGTEHHFVFPRPRKEFNTREGKAYLRLELGDRSGTIEARMWDQFDAAVKDINRDDFVKVQARVEIYRNRPQLSLQQLRLAKPEEIDLADFLLHTKKTLESCTRSCSNTRTHCNPWLKKLVTELSRIRIAAKYKRAPAAKVNASRVSRGA